MDVENQPKLDGTSSSASIRHTKTLQVFSNSKPKDDNDASKRALDIAEVKEHYRHFHSMKHGYMGLGMFLLFMFAYVWILGQQHRASTMGGPNESYQAFFEKVKGDLKVKNNDGLYKLMTGTVVPGLLSDSWTNTTRSGKVLAGRTSRDFFHVVGGLVITAVKGEVHKCFRGNPCYSSQKLEAPFYEIHLPGEAVPFAVPYSSHFGGYSVSVPSSSSKAVASTLLTAYAGLFGPDTREIWLNAVLFNPSGQKTLTSLAYGGSLTINGNIAFHTKLMTIPYHWYQPETMIRQLTGECAVTCFVLWAFVFPLMRFAFLEPQPKHGEVRITQEFRKKWIVWSNEWKHFPAYGGRPRLLTPFLLYSALFVCIIVWGVLGLLHWKMGRLGDESVDWLFVDPLAHTGEELSAKAKASLEAMQRSVLPYLTLIEQISLAYNRYFFLHVLVMTLIVVRLQQYFSFQKRLAVVADTFKHIFDDLMHMTFLLSLVCFLFGVANSLAFGEYDPAYENFSESFFLTVLSSFGLFKPAAGTPFVASLFKYTPHTIMANEFMSWVPMLLQVAFKTLVVLLLFKLLMGVIMEGYKSSAKLKLKAPTVREDLIGLGYEAYNYVWGHLLCGRPWVCCYHVALALSQLDPPKDRPWEKYFLGLDHPQAVEDNLNCVFDGEKMSDQARAKLEEKGIKRCGPEETSYVLRVYGVKREKALVQFKEKWREKKQKEAEEKEKQELIATSDPKASRKLIKNLQVEEEVQRMDDQLSCMRREFSVCAEEEFEEMLRSERKNFEKEELSEVFDEYDTIKIGTVDHHVMPLLFRQLGFRLQPKKLAHLLARYDSDADGNASLKEFTQMVHDDSLLGHWYPPPAETAEQSSSKMQSLTIPLLEA